MIGIVTRLIEKNQTQISIVSSQETSALGVFENELINQVDAPKNRITAGRNCEMMARRRPLTICCTLNGDTRSSSSRPDSRSRRRLPHAVNAAQIIKRIPGAI